MPEPQISVEQMLLTTLVVKLAVMAGLATMLVRYRRFRHILIFERRTLPDRMAFALSLGIPLTAGVIARLLLNYNAADLTLGGSFLAGLIAGPYAGATVGVMVGIPPLGIGEWGALPFAVGCGFAGGGLRELCPKEAIWHFSPFVFTSMPRRVWAMLRSLDVDWQVVLLLAPVALEFLRQIVGLRWSDHHRLFFLHGAPTSPRLLFAVLLATVLAVATPIKHGLSRKVGGGRITIKTHVRDAHTVIEVHDDGLGMTEERLVHALGDGIGLSNVDERLRVIYGANYHLKLTSVPGEGTCVSLAIPELAVPERVTA